MTRTDPYYSGMQLSSTSIADAAANYRTEEPLYAVEAEHVELLPDTFASGEYGRRDAEWVVQWYYRRHLGAFPDADRRAAESRFRENDFETVLERVEAARTAGGTADAVGELIALSGVDVGVASAFLFFLDPSRYLPVGPREWSPLREAGELSDPYPDALSTDDYRRYLRTCRGLADRFDLELWTLYRGLWRLSDRSPGDGSGGD